MSPQKTLTLDLTGRTSTETVSNKVILDVTLPQKWFLLRHEHGFGTLSTSSSDVGTKLSRPPGPTDYGVNPRILKETLRFADMTQNIARLLSILGLVQVSVSQKDPQFRKLVEGLPSYFFTPIWYKGIGQGRSDLMTDARISSLLF